MPDVDVVYPSVSRERGALYWFNPRNAWAARRKWFRLDRSIAWRREFETRYGPPWPARSEPFSRIARNESPHPRIVMLADTGEGDRSQYALLPMIRALDPDLMIINGDVAYPAGNRDDYVAGMLEPYRNLGIPIWAVPGNHEYYSRHRGAEFFEYFCTPIRDAEWYEHGLEHSVRQPGTYWELKEPAPSKGLVILGIDSAKAGNLDGHGWLHAYDRTQHEWLEWRLDLADREKRPVLALFHHPALRGQKHDAAIHLRGVHQLLAAHRSVRMIACGHEHNFQRYDPATFARYLADLYQRDGASDIQYVVSGGGGAYLAATTFRSAGYRVGARYPSESQWGEYASIARRAVDKAPVLSRTLARAVSHWWAGESSDGDVGRFLSFLFVELDPLGAVVTPVFMDDLAELFAGEPPGTRIHVADPSARRHAAALDKCMQEPVIELRWRDVTP